MAEVNGQGITLEEFDRQLRVFRSVRPNVPIDDGLRQQILNQMVKQEALVQEAKRLGLEKDPKVQSAIRQQAESVRKELLDSMANAKAQLEQLDRAVEQRVLIEALLQSQRAAVVVDAAELKAAVEQQLKAAGNPKLNAAQLAEMQAKARDQLTLEKLFAKASGSMAVKLNPSALKQSSVPLGQLP